MLAILVGAVAASIAAAAAGIGLDQPTLGGMLILMWAAWAGQIAAVAFLPLVRGLVEGSPGHRGLPPRGSVCPDRRRGRLRAALTGLVGLLLFWPMTMGAAWIAGVIGQAITGDAPPILAHDLLRRLADAGMTSVAAATMVSVIVVPAIVEEVLYRGLLQESLRRSRLFRDAGPWMSIAAASLFFTAVHIGAVDLHGLVGLFVLSLGFGWAYARTGRLTASITMHMVFNAGNIAAGVPWP